MAIELVRYSETLHEAWERFLDSNPRNGDFMMRRSFLSYHGDRFIDRSVLFLDNSKVIAIFPAASLPSAPRNVITHPGASYGGFAYKVSHGGAPLIDMAGTLIQHYRDSGINTLYIKTKPHLYSSPSGAEDLYAWWRLGAKIEKVDLSNVVEVNKVQFSTRRQRALRKLSVAEIEIKEGSNFLPSAYEICEQTLQSRHNTLPVHTLEDLKFLINALPENLRITVCFADGVLSSALILFVNQNAAVVQYWGSTESGRKINALDPLVVEAIEWCTHKQITWFVPGVSTSESGQKVDDGIYQYKLSLGSGTISIPTLRIDLDSRF